MLLTVSLFYHTLAKLCVGGKLTALGWALVWCLQVPKFFWQSLNLVLHDTTIDEPLVNCTAHNDLLGLMTRMLEICAKNAKSLKSNLPDLIQSRVSARAEFDTYSHSYTLGEVSLVACKGDTTGSARHNLGSFERHRNHDIGGTDQLIGTRDRIDVDFVFKRWARPERIAHHRCPKVYTQEQCLG